MVSHAMMSALVAHERGEPDWFVLACLMQHFGKAYAFLGGVDRDGTSKKVNWGLFGESFVLGHPTTQMTRYVESIYESGCGLSSVTVSFGHAELLYRVLARMRKNRRCNLPDEALFVLRFHSLLSWHSNEEYVDLEDATDVAFKPSIQRFHEVTRETRRELQDAAVHQPKFDELVFKYFPGRAIEF
jgi:inositol oxygenase